MLTITPISFSGIRTLPKTKPVTTPKLEQDKFVKRNNISFKGEAENEFISWAKENNFSEKIGDILSNPNLIIGKGFTHNAYSIPENDEYVLRVGRSQEDFLKDADWKNMKITDSQDKNLTLNIGQSIAFIEAPAKKLFPVYLEVLKKQTGYPLGIKPSATIYTEDGNLRKGELPYEDISRKEYYAKSIHEVSQMPQEAFEKLIDDLNAAGEAGYAFDHLNSNNLLVDTKNQAINLIDMEKGLKKPRWDAVLYALTNIDYYSTYTSYYAEPAMSNEQKQQVTNDTITIIKKFIQAMKNKGEKFDKYRLSYEFLTTMAHSLPFLMTFMVFDKEAAFDKLEKMGLA